MIPNCSFCQRRLTESCSNYDPYDHALAEFHCTHCLSPILSFSKNPHFLSRMEVLFDYGGDYILSASIITESDLFLITAEYSINKTRVGRYAKLENKILPINAASVNKDGFVVIDMFEANEIFDLWDKNIVDKIKFWATYS